MCARFFLILLFYLHNVLAQGTGSGTNGNLRLCIIDGRGTYKRAPVYCPILDNEKSGVECVLGTDRLDCLRRISKGTVDFGVFSPEDLIAAQWAQVDVLVTNELRLRDRPFARNIVAVVNKRILPEGSSTLHAVLRNSTLCHPGESLDELRPLSETLSGYLETLILERSCDSTLSNTENKLKSLANFYGKACKAGPWVPDRDRDAELKREFPSLCAACKFRGCSKTDPYYGDVGALNCLTEGAGDVTWGEAADVAAYLKNHTNFVYLCRDGTWRAMSEEPCVWLKRPWNVLVAKRKASEAVSHLTKSLTNSSFTIDTHWRGALLALLESNRGLTEPLQPAMTAIDYLAKAEGFREAYSQTGCDPPRHINFCTTSILERNKCEWLSEAGAVYGVVPSLQCVLKNSTEECLRSVSAGESDAAVGDSDHLITATRLSLQPLLHEITQIVQKTHTVVAYVKNDTKITKMSDLRGKRAAFPRYGGMTWHSVLRYITKHEKISCKDYIDNYFKEICAPGLDGKNCYEASEKEALKSLLEDKSDVAFVSMNTYLETTEQNRIKFVPVCPEDSKRFCFISWSNLGHVFTAKNLTAVRKHEIMNVFMKLDQIFGKFPPFHNAMFSMYGPFNHQKEVIFHSDTKNLRPGEILTSHPFDKIPLNFELSISNVTDFSCNFGAKVSSSLVILLVTLVALVINS